MNSRRVNSSCSTNVPRHDAVNLHEHHLITTNNSPLHQGFVHFVYKEISLIGFEHGDLEERLCYCKNVLPWNVGNWWIDVCLSPVFIKIIACISKLGNRPVHSHRKWRALIWWDESHMLLIRTGRKWVSTSGLRINQ